MQIVLEHTLDITGFAGVRERVYVMDSQQFSGSSHEEAADGLGPFVYLADAHIRPGGSTGMHAHSNIDIVTIMLRGELSHQGSLGHGTVLHQGSAQIQFSGRAGFSHNEVNASGSFNRFIQIWVKPDTAALNDEAEYHDIHFDADNTTRLYTHPATEAHLDFIGLKPKQKLVFENDALVFLIEGDLLVSEGEHNEQVIGTGLVRSIKEKHAITSMVCEKASQLIAIHSEAKLFINDTK